jgi:NADH:ubiquinone oxidoreductase subunit C
LPDATGLELLAQDLRAAPGLGDDAVLDAVHFRGQATLEVESVTADWPTANHQEREVYDMFGVLFTGHPDPRRILMPEDYEGHPQRRDFPVGGEPVLFTKDHDRDYTR